MTDEKEENVLEEVAGMYAEDTKAMMIYINDSYTEKVHSPTPPDSKDLTFFALAGFETISFSVPALAMALFSAVRTGQFFYVLELLMLTQYNLITGYLANGLAFTVMLLSLFGFEGYILARGIKNGRKKVVLAGDAVEVESNGLATGLSFLVILSIAMFSGTELIDNLSEVFIRNMNIYMVFITGLASTVLVFFGGDDIGIASESYTVKKRRLLSQHADDYQEWWDGAVRSWVGVKASQSKKGKSKKQMPVDENEQADSSTGSSDWRKLKLTLSKQQMVDLSNLDLNNKKLKKEWADTFGVVEKTIENRKAQARKFVAEEFLTDFISANNKFPTNEEMKNANLYQKAVASFVLKNQTQLLNDGMISDEFLNKAKELLNG